MSGKPEQAPPPYEETQGADDQAAADEPVAEDLANMTIAESAASDEDDNPFVAQLPEEARAKVGELRKLHEKRIELEEQFEEERRALLMKYAALEAPLNDSRKSILVKEDKTAAIEGFWLQVFTNCTHTREVMLVGDKDPEALKHLLDVRCVLLEDARSFKFEFEFGPNPYFEDEVLTKTYTMDEDNDPTGSEGHDISWKPGKNLTVKLKKKKKGGKNRPAVTKTEPCETFFNWFYPPKVPDEDDESMDEQAEEELEEALEQDFDLGLIMKDKIIPHAIMWFVGEAMDSDDDESEEDDEEDDEEDSDDDDDDEDDAPPPKKGGRRAGGSTQPKSGEGGASAFPAAAGPPGEQPECKQQ